jgi:FXSXX-COOH protein
LRALLITAVTEWHLPPCPRIARKDEKTLLQQELSSDLPDLRELPLDRLDELGDSVLANSIDLYLQRLKESSETPFNSFNSGI